MSDGYIEMGYNIEGMYDGKVYKDPSANTLYVFGGGYNPRPNLIENLGRIVFMPGAGGHQIIREIENPVQIETFDLDPVHTIEGTYALFDNENKLIYGSPYSIIPEGTTSIGDYAFQNVNFVTEIKIPSSITQIGNYSFQNCKNLESIDIPSNVTSIAHTAFAGCTDLEKITVYSDNIIYDSRDNCNAIIETSTNKLIVGTYGTIIPLSVTAVGPNAFSTKTNTDVVVPSSVTSFGDKAFDGTCCVYFESLTPPAISGDIFGWGAVFVPEEAYEAYCTADVWSDYKDKIVTREMSEKDIEVYSTEGMSGVLNAVGLNEADKIVKLKVKGDINSYDIIVFRDKMPLLNDLDLSEANVIASNKPYYQTYCTEKNFLGKYAFYGLDKLVNVKLPKSIKVLGEYTFSQCDNLNRVDASGTDGLNIGAYAFELSGIKEFIAPRDLGEIGSLAFYRCRYLNKINFSNVFGSIQRSAFQETNLHAINIDSIGGDIGQDAFLSNYKLSEVKIGIAAGELQSGAFEKCKALTNVEFEKGPVKIGSLVFDGSEQLESFVAGEGLLEIASSAFVLTEIEPLTLKTIVVDRTHLTTIKLPNSVQKIGGGAFSQCTAFKEFSMPESITSLGAAFSGCTSLESITIPSGVTEIAEGTFSGCTSLKKVTFSDGLKIIGNGAFAGCDLEELILPPSVTTIKGSAFKNCKISELHLPSSLEFIGDYAFEGCVDLNSIYTYTIEPTVITEKTFSTFNTATLNVPTTSFWNYYYDIGWSKFDHKKFQYFNEPYTFFYLNYDYYLNGSRGYVAGTPDVDMRPGSGLIVESHDTSESNQQNLGNVTLASDGNGNSASIIGDDILHIDNLHVKINVKKGRWYFFAFPWDVPMDKISMQNGNDYVFRYYDGAERAKNGQGGWKNVNDSHLKAAQGYIFQSAGDDVLTLSIEDIQFSSIDKYCELMVHASENVKDASWNLMGNPYTCFYDMSATDYTAPVTVWDGEKYVAIRPGDDDYQFAPYEAFFLQKPEGTESVKFSAEEQMTKTEAEALKAQQARARRARKIDPQRLLVNIELSMDSVCDRTRVVFNDSQKHTYEMTCDAAKFESDGVPQVYTIDNEGVCYAINERPMDDGIVLIGYKAPQSGYYTIKAARMDTEVVLYDEETKETHEFKNGAYVFYSDEGTFEKRFSLGVPERDVTAVKEVNLDEAIEVVEGGIEFYGNAPVAVYNIEGMLITTQNGVGTLKLQPGVYVVVMNKAHKKIVVK